MARLVCTDGPLSGQQFLLEEEEVVVGRATENAVSIPDTSVSRRHLSLRRDGNAWLARDLGSGNGTLLNGEQLATETQLRDGDLLTLGDTVLRYSDGSSETVLLAHPPPPPARSRGGAVMETVPPRRLTSEVTARPSGRVRPTRSQMPAVSAQANSRSLLLIAFAVVSLLLAVGLVAYKVWSPTPQPPPGPVARPAAAEPPRTQVLLEEVARLLREQKWELALKSLEELQQLQPGEEQVGKYVEFARKELANEEALAQANAALRQDQLQEAAEALKKVSDDTTLYPRLEDLREDLARRAEWRVKKARDLLELDRPTPARAEVEKVLAALPQHAEALQVKELVLQALRNRSAPKPAPQPPPKRDRPREPREPKEPKRQPWELAVEHYMAGELPKALEQLATCQDKPRCKSLGEQVAEARDLLGRVQSLALEERIGLLELDRHITDDRGSRLAAPVAAQVAEELCSKAASAKAGGNWALTLEHLQSALWASPSSGCAKALLDELLTLARSQVEDAANAAAEGKTEAARQTLRQVLVMTPPDQDVHKQAKARLEELPK